LHITPQHTQPVVSATPHCRYRLTISDIYAGQPLIYGAVVQGVHPVGGCGEVTGDDGEHTALNAVSSDGQCRGQEGLECVTKNNQTFCPGDENNPGAQPTQALGTLVVHEFGHSFGDQGSDDHTGQRCEQRGAIAPDRAPSLNTHYASICPDVWARVQHSAVSRMLPEVNTPIEGP